jgi:aspartyl-tRNA(Asn)/glutamyl-tRNA(Gln) amidotransferase subunit A
LAHPLDLPVAIQAARVRDPGDPLTAGALVEESLRRIEAGDGALHAFLHVTASIARAKALEVDETVGRGGDPGPLAGIPLAVKDNLAVPGAPMTCASRILEGYRPPRWATSVERAVRAGACIVGKTNLDEFAMGSSTENSAFGPTRNPWDLGRVPGGSSGGSAAAVAAGLVPLALGSDTGGSIRQPAALCGIVGVKPSYGRVSRNGLTAFASSLDQVGPMARTVEDAARLLAAVAGPDPLDATSRAFAHPPVPEAPTPLRGLRVGIVAEMDTGPGEASDAVQRVREALGAAGAREVAVRVPAARLAIPVYYILAPAEASSNLARFDGVRYGLRVPSSDLFELYARTRDRGFGPEVKRRILVGTFSLSAGYADAFYQRAMAARALLTRQIGSAFAAADVLLTATTPGPAFPLGAKTEDPLAMYLCDVLTVAANLAGVPAASIPAGRTAAGLPLGVQLWAPHGRDDLLLGAAAAVASAAGTGYEPPPGARAA